MRHAIAILCLLLATSALAAETVEETLGTGEVMAFGLNTYIVYLEISDLAADPPSWVLGASGVVVGGMTLLLKDYDGTLFGHFFTGIAAADLVMGGILMHRAGKADGNPLGLRPVLRQVDGRCAPGIGLGFRF